MLGWHEIRCADGLLRTAELRFGENVQAWDRGHALLYYAHEAQVGKQADGRPLAVWGLEWTNPRPTLPIASVTLHGATPSPETRLQGGVSTARPIPLGITAVDLPRPEDY